jgi:hypothetical protein
LLELPQRHHRDRHDDTAAYPGDGTPVQQLSRQYGGEFHDLYDEPHGGQRQPMRLLPQRIVYRAGHQRRSGEGWRAYPDRGSRLHLLPRQYNELRQWWLIDYLQNDACGRVGSDLRHLPQRR